MMLRRPLPLFCLALFLSTFLRRAADWPRWRGPENTGWVPAGASVPATLPAEPKLLWEVKLGDGVGSPAVAEGRVFCLDNRNEKETLCAYDLAEGKELWNVPIDDVITDTSAPVPAARRSSTARESSRNRAAASSNVSTRPTASCLAGQLRQGFRRRVHRRKRRRPGRRRHGYTGPPLVDGQRIIVGVGGRHGASVVCFDKTNGNVLWKSQDDIPGYCRPGHRHAGRREAGRVVHLRRPHRARSPITASCSGGRR